jgi:hypothetical protein
MNNHQKHFHKVYINLLRSYGCYSNIDELKQSVAEDIIYLSRTFDVKFSDTMSWVSPYLNFADKDFGRFNVKFSANSSMFFLHHPKHKHPHSYSLLPRVIGGRIYYKTCVGSETQIAFNSGRLFHAYKLYNSVIKNISSDACATTGYHGNDVIKICHNFNLKNYKTCDNCSEGILTEDGCGYYGCSASPFRDTNFNEYEFDEDDF